jgi:DNA mismatch repair protein MutS
LVNAERYITQELKDMKKRYSVPKRKIQALESNLFNELVLSIVEYIPAIQANASLIAQTDCLLSFSKVAKENKYIRPEINDTDVLKIKNGRHPVIEKQLPLGEKLYCQ